MSISAEASSLASLLLALTQPDTEGIRNAEATLKPLLKNPNCIPALFEILFARGAQVSVQKIALQTKAIFESKLKLITNLLVLSSA